MRAGSAFLDRIMKAKRDAMAGVSAAMRSDVRAKALEAIVGREKRRFGAALSRMDGINVIAEVKRSSPSAGAIKKAANAVETAKTYEDAGAAAISVLTEPEFFQGSMEDLQAVASVVRVPVLRKDFTVDRHQIYEAAAAGASAVLLIVAGVRREELRELREVAEVELGLDALVEAHSAREIDIAITAGATLIGVNNRNLQTLEVSLQVSRELAQHISDGKIFVSESGIKTAADIAALRELGYRGFLIGESLMRSENPANALRELAAGAAR